jgi:hypothetical protein
MNLVALDIETENTGYDIMNDNKRIISIQLLNGTDTRLYYDGSLDAGLYDAVSDLQSMIKNDWHFVGFNIKNFDIPMLKRFLDVEIPQSQTIEITEMKPMDVIRKKTGRQRPRLEDTCAIAGIECNHKKEMNQFAQKYKIDPGVRSAAKEAAKIFQMEKGWSHDFSLGYAIDKISGGMAIMSSFDEFVSSGGNTDTLFYRYAIGDVVAESALYSRLSESIS